MNMKENNNFEVRGSGLASRVFVGSQLAGATIDPATESAHPGGNPIYRCKNCGRPLSSYDIINFYGLPACPVCFNAAAPFEVELLASDSEAVAMHT
jgi:hypothetical protein